MQEIDRLQLVKDKIVRTDEVLKLLFERKTDLEKISTKYQLVLNKYLEKCKHYDKLKEECNDVCILNDQQQTTISALQEELSQCKAEHTKLQVTYAEFVNHSHLEYQNIIKEHETKIALLEDEASKAKKTCASCNKTIKNVDQFVFERTGSPERCKRRRKLKEDTQIILPSPEKSMHEINKIREEATANISSLQSKLARAELENMNLKNEVQRFEDDCNTLRKDNIAVKGNMRELQDKNEKLEERLGALKLEIEVMNFSKIEKSSCCDIGIQTETNKIEESSFCDIGIQTEANKIEESGFCDTGIQTEANKIEESGVCHIGIQTETTDYFDVASDIVDGFCDELCSIPRLISPLQDVCGIDNSEPQGFFDQPATMGLEVIAAFEGDVRTDVIENIETEPIKEISNLNLNIANLSTEYKAFMHDDIAEEPNLLGFLPVSEHNLIRKGVLRKNLNEHDNNLTKHIRRKSKTRKRNLLLKRYSHHIYKKVLRDVLKHFKSSNKLSQKYRKRKRAKRATLETISDSEKCEEGKKVDHKPESDTVLKAKDTELSNDCNLQQQPIFPYDVFPNSVDSGYSAQMSECSEILQYKVSEFTNTDDNKIKKIELFGSDSESDLELSDHAVFSSESIASCENESVACEKTLSDDTLQSKRRNQNNKRNAKAVREFKSPKCRKKVVNCQTQQDYSQILLPTNVAVNNQTELTTPNNIVISNFVTGKSALKTDCAKRVFKRPNCRKRAFDSPRSPEPMKQDQELPEKTVIIPLNKPKTLSVAVVNNLFKKLLTYPEETKILEEVSEKFSNQEPVFISKTIIDALGCDYSSKVENKENPFAPLLTEKQKVLLGFIVKLESKNVSNIVATFLIESEKCILQEKSIERIIPVTRLYMAVCKMKRDIHRMRKTCLDALYFMGDLAIPFLYTVLTSWAEVLPSQSQSYSVIPKVIVQIINLKTCNFPGYNLTNLRTIISKLHGYPTERWNSDELFSEIVADYKENAGRKDLEVAVLIFCKNHSASWVAEKLDKLTDSILSSENLLLKEKTAELIHRVMMQFNVSTDATCIERAEVCRNKLLST